MLKKIFSPLRAAFFNLIDSVHKPQPVQRSEQEIRRLAKEASCIALYDYKGCAASRQARREIQRLNIDIERRDIGKCSIHQDNLLAQFGELKAPCLRIEEKGQVRWLDEPDDIVHFLHERFDIQNDDLQQRKSA
ncbi:MAG: glutaredoxin [Gammaproteobacteria bacterium]|nr:glutaredoxin [Gammaproteobacteria bacterium]|tara:strand:- start:114 stop:515 length:402 start_codon:yes stop_codon:yes gene_type:complete